MNGTIAVIGAGNIGTFLCQFLARLPEVTKLIIVDHDRYSAGNLAGQSIDHAHVDRPKAMVQAKLAKRIRPDLDVSAIVARVEQVPLGELRCGIICGCLDSRLSRMTLNELSYKLGVPLIDAGVLASQMLARVSVFEPSASGACLECAWGDDDYANLEVEFQCRSGQPSVAPTNAPAYLGAVAAGLQAAECRKLLAGGRTAGLAGKQLIVGLDPHLQCVSELWRNPDCRFGHDVWNINDAEPLRPGVKIGQLAVDNASVSVAGGRFALRSTCTGCGRTADILRLIRPHETSNGRCRHCGGVTQVSPFHWQDRLSAGHLTRAARIRTLRGIGVRVNDAVTCTTAAGDVHRYVRA